MMTIVMKISSKRANSLLVVKDIYIESCYNLKSSINLKSERLRHISSRPSIECSWWNGGCLDPGTQHANPACGSTGVLLGMQQVGLRGLPLKCSWSQFSTSHSHLYTEPDWHSRAVILL